MLGHATNGASHSVQTKTAKSRRSHNGSKLVSAKKRILNLSFIFI